eukprot:GAFH01004918.1.p4 GENE.GAFH01004918.1~~GAFH01004918.1.p4  ORF type:complete len:57 (-),score=3.01 GAFH01004918.1:410-580(-)
MRILNQNGPHHGVCHRVHARLQDAAHRAQEVCLKELRGGARQEPFRNGGRPVLNWL